MTSLGGKMVDYLTMSIKNYNNYDSRIFIMIIIPVRHCLIILPACRRAEIDPRPEKYKIPFNYLDAHKTTNDSKVKAVILLEAPLQKPTVLSELGFLA